MVMGLSKPLAGLIMTPRTRFLIGSTDQAPANFTTIKHMAHNLLRTVTSKDSLRLRRKVAAWDDDFLASLIAR
jgi:hypothetical protein